MKVRVVKKEDGTVDLHFIRTRPAEGRNTHVEKVTAESLSAVVSREVKKMRGEPAEAG